MKPPWKHCTRLCVLFIYFSMILGIQNDEKVIEELKKEKRQVLQEMNANSKEEIRFERKLKEASDEEKSEIKNHIRRVVKSTERLYKIATEMKNLWEEFKIANRNQDDINKDYGRISGYIRKYLSREEKSNFDEFIRERIKLVLIYLDIQENLKKALDAKVKRDENKDDLPR